MESYSAWSQFRGWEKRFRYVAGCPEYHFILDEGNLYRLKPDETRAVLVKDLPIKPNGIRWGGGALWLFSDAGKSCCFLDPVSLECKTEPVLSKFFFFHPEAEILSITTDALFLKRHSDKEEKDILCCFDRKTHKMALDIYKAKWYYFFFFNFGPDFVHLWELLTETQNWDLIVDSKGSITPLEKHPDVAPLLPRILHKLKEVYEVVEDEFSECRTRRERLEYLFNKIVFIDFFARKLYFSTTRPAGSAVADCEPIYVLPFDGGPVDVAWRRPNDFSKATWQPDSDPGPWDTPGNIWERLFQFDGAHAVGLDRSGTNWIFQTPEGEVIDLGKIDHVEDNYALLGDELYVRVKNDGWYKFHLAHDVPEARKIELIEEG